MHYNYNYMEVENEKNRLKRSKFTFFKVYKMVRNGQEIILLTNRGKLLTIIKPFKQEQDPEQRIRQMEEQRLLKPSIKEKFPLHKLVIILKGTPLSKIVSREREGRNGYTFDTIAYLKLYVKEKGLNDVVKHYGLTRIFIG